MGDRQYLVLETPIPVDELQLGSLVTDYGHPSREFFFEDHLKGKQKWWVRTDKNIKELMTVGSSRTEQSLLRRMLSTSPANDLSETYELQSLECCVYELRKAKEWFAELLSLPEARSWVEGNLQQNRQVYLLTGFRTFRDGILRKRRNVKKTSASINIGVPASVALPGIPEMSLEWSRSESEGSQPQYQAHEELIFAVSYREIKSSLFGQKFNPYLKYGHDWLRPWTKQGAESSHRSRASYKGFTSMAERSLPNEPGGSVKGAITEYPSLLSSKAILELVIETDGSDEFVQLEEDGVSFDGDDHSKILTEDGDWPETRDDSRTPVDRNVERARIIQEQEDRTRLRAADLARRDREERARHREEADNERRRAAEHDRFRRYREVEEQRYARARQANIPRRPRHPTFAHQHEDHVDRGERSIREAIREENLRQFERRDRWPHGGYDDEVGYLSALLTEVRTLHARVTQVVTRDSLGFALAFTFALGTTFSVSFLLGLFPISSVCTFAAIWIAHRGMTTREMGGRILSDSPMVNRMINKVGSLCALLTRDTQQQRIYTRALQVVTKDALGFTLVWYILVMVPLVLFLLRRSPKSSVCILAAAAVWIAYLELRERRKSGRVQLYSTEKCSSHSWPPTFSAVCKDPQTYLRIPAPLFVTSFVSYLRVISRPIARPGFQRVEWTCVSTPASFERPPNFEGLTGKPVTFLGMW